MTYHTRHFKRALLAATSAITLAAAAVGPSASQADPLRGIVAQALATEDETIKPDTGIFALSRLAATVAAPFADTSSGTLEGDLNLIERIRSQRSGFHTRYSVTTGLDEITGQPVTTEGTAGSPRNARTTLEDLPITFIQAVLATEDARFFDHPGVDPIATIRAAIGHLEGRTRGASGITQQLVKNQLVGSAPTLSRKIVEAVLSIRIEQDLSKRDILEAYLGAVWFGRGYGAGGAAQSWFGKPWDQLTLGETAFLAGVLQGPALLNPERHPERAKARRDHVLGRMLETGAISKEDHDAATAEILKVIPNPPTGSARNWVEVAIEGWARSGRAGDLLEPRADQGELPLVETTIDQRWQDIAQNALTRQMDRLGATQAMDQLTGPILEEIAQAAAAGERTSSQNWSTLTANLASDERATPAIAVIGDQGLRLAIASGWGPTSTWRLEEPKDAPWLKAGDVVMVDRTTKDVLGARPVEGAVVVMNIHTGEVLATVGGSDIRISKFDRTRALRQPGSTMKAFVYLAAMEMGWGPMDLVSDAPMTFGSGYRPQNFGGNSYGLMALTTAFEISSNVAAVRIASEVGIGWVSEVAQLAGAYEGPIDPYLPSALGATSTTLLRLTTGYATIGNGGYRVDPVLVRAIDSPEGRVDMPATPGQRVFSDRAIEAMHGMMRGVITRGTATNAFSNHPVAVIGKTGTSQENRDALFIGMGADVAVGVWIGRDDNRPTNGFLGGEHAAPVAAEILKSAFEAGMIDASGTMTGNTDQRMWPPEGLNDGQNAPVLGGGIVTEPLKPIVPIRSRQEITTSDGSTQRRERPMGGAAPTEDYFGRTEQTQRPIQPAIRPTNQSTGGNSGFFATTNRNEGLLRN